MNDAQQTSRASQVVRIGVLGCGNVGAALVELVESQAATVEQRTGLALRVTRVAVRNMSAPRGVELADGVLTRDAHDVVVDPDIDMVVEAIGGIEPARGLILAALEHGKPVVTANKELLANCGAELYAAADAAERDLLFEAAVAGGVPIMRALRESLYGEPITRVMGIINGTTNFILTKMTDAVLAGGEGDYAATLAEAQALGYAEANPAFDVEGTDAAHKLVILASLAFGTPLRIESVYTEGITGLQTQDVFYARELGYVIKHLAIAKQNGAGVELRVHPTLIPENLLLADVDGVKNAILIEGDAVGPTLYYGAGAGGRPTASAVVADLVDLVRDAEVESGRRLAPLGVDGDALRDLPVVPMAEVATPWYLRMAAEDKPGVLSRVASLFSDQGISIEALIQKPPTHGQTQASVIVVTNRARQGSVDQAVAAIEALETIAGKVTRIRVEELDG